MKAIKARFVGFRKRYSRIKLKFVGIKLVVIRRNRGLLELVCWD